MTIDAAPEALTTRSSSVPRTMTRTEVRSETKRNLMIISDKVYDVTDWLLKHPGGALALQELMGRDATNSFFANHPEYVHRYLPILLVGQLNASDCTPSTSIEMEFQRLKKKIEEMGLFELDGTYWTKKILLYLALIALVFVGVAFSSSTLVHLVCAVVLGLTWQQTAFIGHDCGHNGISHSREKECRLGLLVGNFMTGISMSWWKRNHNIHHIVTNSVDADPDIQHLPFLAMHPAYIQEEIYSTFYSRKLEHDPVMKVLIRYQHVLYFVVMGLSRFNLYAQSIQLSLRLGAYSRKNSPGEVSPYPWGEPLTLLGFWIWHLTLLSLLPSWRARLLFAAVSHVVTGILGWQITLSHYPMPAYRGIGYENDANGFVWTQLDGTLNIESSVWMDWFHGGLQFQVEHHLFPRLPRHNLRRAKPEVKAFCAKFGLPYRSVSFLEANRMTIRALKQTAKEAVKLHPLVWDVFNVVG